jgi:hypothetical protein
MRFAAASLVCAKWHTLFRIVPGQELTDSIFSRAEASFEAKLRKIGWKDPYPWSVLMDMALPNET